MPETSIRSGSSRRAAAIGGSAGQIHMEFGTFHCDIGVGIRSQCGLHGLRHISVCLEAAGADAGTQRRQQLSGTAPIGRTHGCHGFLHDPAAQPRQPA